MAFMRTTTAPNHRKAPKGVRQATLSPDGKWKSFPRTPNLVQYVSTGQYYGRVKVRGNTIRRKLKATVHSDAVLRFFDFLKEQRTKTPLNGDAEDMRALVRKALSAKEESTFTFEELTKIAQDAGLFE